MKKVPEYVFNESGTLVFVADTHEIPPEIRRRFEDVTMFYAAMLKALTSTPIACSDPLICYDAFYYDGLKNIINGSDFFSLENTEEIPIKIPEDPEFMEEKILKQLTSFSVNISELSFAKEMAKGVCNAAQQVNGNECSETKQVGLFIFLFKYLEGIPFVRALMIRINANDLNPHSQEQLCFTKDTYAINMPGWDKG